MADDTMVLYDEDGNELRFQFLDEMKDHGKQYVALLPLDEKPGEQEVLILEVRDNPETGEQDFALVENKKKNSQLYEQFKRNHRGEYDFRD